MEFAVSETVLLQYISVHYDRVVLLSVGQLCYQGVVFTKAEVRFRLHQANAKAKVTSLTYAYCCFPFNYPHQAMSKIKVKNRIRVRFCLV